MEKPLPFLKYEKTIFTFFLFYTCGSFRTGFVAADTLPAGIMSEHELSPEAYDSWKTIQGEWLKGTYQDVLKKNKIKVNCKDCSSFYMEVIISIDKSGKMSYYKLLNGIKCGEPITKGIELQLMKFFFSQAFPPSLYDIKFRTRLGKSLKC
ncbi:MAG: hypothetical protein M3R27_13765 [Bacteroidota bacterium]|nr:hypothetical protein [Bacteroidota bacterium]